MYAKLENGVLYRSPKKITEGNMVIFNPTVDMLITLGYLPVVMTDPPEEGYAEAHWEEQNGEIVQVWEIIDDEGISSEEMAEALEELL